MTVQSYYQKYCATLAKWVGSCVRETVALKYQCVAWAKKYSEETGYPLGYFSGNAINAWKTGSPFNAKWKRVTYSSGAVPNAGDVVFFAPTAGNEQNGHVGIATTLSTPQMLGIVEQNAGSGNGDGKGANAITKRVRSYTDKNFKVLGWFTRI